MTLFDTDQKATINIDLQPTARQRITINNDPNRVLELNTTDLSLITRLHALYPKLKQLSADAIEEFGNTATSDTEDFLTQASETLTRIDNEMRRLIDELFDAPVSRVCAPSGTMYDPIGGKLRFEYILEALASLYEENLKKEVDEISANISKHTDKYTTN